MEMVVEKAADISISQETDEDTSTNIQALIKQVKDAEGTLMKSEDQDSVSDKQEEDQESEEEIGEDQEEPEKPTTQEKKNEYVGENTNESDAQTQSQEEDESQDDYSNQGAEQSGPSMRYPNLNGPYIRHPHEIQRFYDQEEEQQQQEQEQRQGHYQQYVSPGEGPIDMSLAGHCGPSNKYGHGDTEGSSRKQATSKIVNGKRVGIKPVNPKFDRSKRFPNKLYAAACNENIEFIRWSPTGNAIIVNEKLFEENVMKQCPGLVMCQSFDNFRRQLREYCFECRYINMPYQFDYEFIHPNFQYEREDLLDTIRTRRRILKEEKDALEADEESSPMINQRRRFKRKSSTQSQTESDSPPQPNCKHTCQVHHDPQPPQHYHHQTQCHVTSQWSHGHYATGSGDSGSHCNVHSHGNCSPLVWSPPSTPTNLPHAHSSHSCGSLHGASPHSHLRTPLSHQHQQSTSPLEHPGPSLQIPTPISASSLNPSPLSHSHLCRDPSPLGNPWQYQQHPSCGPSSHMMWGSYGYQPPPTWNHHACSPFMQPTPYQPPELSHSHYHGHGHSHMDVGNQMSMQQEQVSMGNDSSSPEMMYLQEPQVRSTPTSIMMSNQMIIQQTNPDSDGNILMHQENGQTISVNIQQVEVADLQVDETNVQNMGVDVAQEPSDRIQVMNDVQENSESAQEVDVGSEQEVVAEGSPVDASIPQNSDANAEEDASKKNEECEKENVKSEDDVKDNEKGMIENGKRTSNTQMLTNFTMLTAGNQGESLQQQLHQQIAASQ